MSFKFFELFDKPKNKDHVLCLPCPMSLSPRFAQCFVHIACISRDKVLIFKSKNTEGESLEFFHIPGPLYREKPEPIQGVKLVIFLSPRVYMGGELEISQVPESLCRKGAIYDDSYLT